MTSCKACKTYTVALVGAHSGARGATHAGNAHRHRLEVWRPSATWQIKDKKQAEHRSALALLRLSFDGSKLSVFKSRGALINWRTKARTNYGIMGT